MGNKRLRSAKHLNMAQICFLDDINNLLEPYFLIFQLLRPLPPLAGSRGSAGGPGQVLRPGSRVSHSTTSPRPRLLPGGQPGWSRTLRHPVQPQDPRSAAPGELRHPASPPDCLQATGACCSLVKQINRTKFTINVLHNSWFLHLFVGIHNQ